MGTCAGIVLAAGAGTRFGGPKAPAIIDGERLVDHAVRILREAGCEPVIVVLGAWIGEVEHAEIVVNDAWEEGMGTSLRVGLEAVLDSTATSALVTLVDLPGMTVDAATAVREHPGALVAAAYDGKRGHPVKFPRETWGDVITNAKGDEGARALLNDRADLILVEVGQFGSGQDLDTPPGT